MSIGMMALVLLPDRTQLGNEIQSSVLVVILTGSKKETWRYSIRSLASLKSNEKSPIYIYLDSVPQNKVHLTILWCFYC